MVAGEEYAREQKKLDGRKNIVEKPKPTTSPVHALLGVFFVVPDYLIRKRPAYPSQVWVKQMYQTHIIPML